MSENLPAEQLWLSHGLPRSFLSLLHLTKDPDPSVDSSFKLGSVAQTAIGLAGLSAAYLHYLRTGERREVHVDARHAVLEFKSEMLYTINDEVPSGKVHDEIAGLYPTKDGRMVRLHTNFPHHRNGILSILNCTDTPTREAVSRALLQLDAFEFESEAAVKGMCANAMRSFEEWDRHPHGIASKGEAPVAILKLAGAPTRKRTLPKHTESEESPGGGAATKPLDGMRILDLSRVLAGPVCGRTLAGYGANVLLVKSPNLPSLPLLDIDTSRGKRTALLDICNLKDSEILKDLVKDADVFLQAYRPGALEGKSFGAVELAERRMEGGGNGIFDSLVQTATGFNLAEGAAYDSAIHPDVERSTSRVLPMQALDHAAGYLLAFGINVALCKTILEGGSWEVRVSLLGVANWARSLGRVDALKAFGEHIHVRDDSDGVPRSRLSIPKRSIPLDPELEPLMEMWPAKREEGPVRSWDSVSPDLGVEDLGAEDKEGDAGRFLKAIRHAAVFKSASSSTVAEACV